MVCVVLFFGPLLHSQQSPGGSDGLLLLIGLAVRRLDEVPAVGEEPVAKLDRGLDFQSLHVPNARSECCQITMSTIDASQRGPPEGAGLANGLET